MRTFYFFEVNTDNYIGLSNVKAYNVRHAKSLIDKLFKDYQNLISVDLCTTKGVWTKSRNEKWQHFDKDYLLKLHKSYDVAFGMSY